ncbi:MAG: hypothetical protein QOE64_80 [Frankiales bacterium]|jgi:hypothetical protein|nr:hypothetical protein [Frankiales bacterium]
MRLRPPLAVALLGLLGALATTAPASQAAAPTVGTLSRTSGPVSWTGSWTQSDPIGCGRPQGEMGCDRKRLVVNAAAGTWVTIAVQERSAPAAIDVTTDDGVEVAQGGDRVTGSDQSNHPVVTFAQVRSGAVGYLVGTSTDLVIPSTPVDSTTYAYHVKATLSGRAVDRDPDCFQIPPDHVPAIPADTSKRLRVSVRILSAPKDAAEVRREMPFIAHTYAKIGIAVRLSYDTIAVRPGSIDNLLEQAKARYGGIRPRGVDVVFLATDEFGGGGYADCVGGVAYGERAFAVGDVHYAASGAVPVPYVKAGLIAAHEIGHLLGAHHHYAECGAWAEPDTVTEGTVGPCTLMFPAAAGASGTFSPVETAYIRDYASHYAHG